MKPLFPFYGSKWRDAKRYGPPGAHVIEPFAGSARLQHLLGARARHAARRRPDPSGRVALARRLAVRSGERCVMHSSHFVDRALRVLGWLMGFWSVFGLVVLFGIPAGLLGIAAAVGIVLGSEPSE